MATVEELEKKIEKLERELAALQARASDDEGVYVLNNIERREVRKGLSDRLATDEEVKSVLSRYGLQDTL